MSIVVEAVYENGVFRPLKRVELPEGVRVVLKVVKSSRNILKVIDRIAEEYSDVEEDVLEKFLAERR